MLQVFLVEVASGSFHHDLGLLGQWLVDVCQIVACAFASGITSLGARCLRLSSPLCRGSGRPSSIITWLPDHDVIDEVLRPKLMSYRLVRPGQGSPLHLLGEESLAPDRLLQRLNERMDGWLLQPVC